MAKIWRSILKSKNLGAFEIGRVILEHKERYIIKAPDNEFEAELMR